MPDKHLVLDPDVHESLTQKKRQKGVPLRQIGNSILRNALDRPELTDAVAKALIRSGKISREEYEQARRDALASLEGYHASVAGLVKPTSEGTLRSGSWEFASTGSRIPSEYHIIEAWSTDSDQQPLPLHCHESSDEFIVMIEGRLLLMLADSQRILVKGDLDKIPSGTPHSVTPLTDDTKAVVVCSPPDQAILDAYRNEAAHQED